MATTTATPADAAADQRLHLLEKRFGREYKIEHCPDDPSSYFLKPKDNPPVWKATLFPLFKTRYKFKVTFGGDSSVSYEDMYALTFNRTNGSSPGQQERIRRRTKEFGEEVDRLREEVRYYNVKKRKRQGSGRH